MAKTPIGNGNEQQITDVRTKKVTRTASVASLSSETTRIYAPENEIWRVTELRALVNSDGNATSGTHRLSISSEGQWWIPHLYLKSNYNTNIQFDRGYSRTADAQALPTTEAATERQVQGIRITDSVALHLDYLNNTDVAQDKDRDYRIVYEVLTNG